MINIVKVKEDLTGKKFGRLTVIEQVEDKVSSGNRRAQWKCLCDCGNTTIVMGENLKRGTTKSCGCYNIEKVRERSFKDITGMKFGKLTVIRKYDVKNNKRIRWLCQCDCGNIKIVIGDDLKSGHTKSCGCYTKEKQKEIHKKYNTYELTGEYGIGYTSKGEEFYFDLEDYDKIKDYCWYKTPQGYIASRVGEECVEFHRLVLNIGKDNYDCDVDHICHNKCDNRKAQLRIVTRSQNSMNAQPKKTNTSGVVGVYWDKCRNKWAAYIKKNYKNIYIGRFESKDDAIKARKEAEEKYFGEYSYDNSMKKWEEIYNDLP